MLFFLFLRDSTCFSWLCMIHILRIHFMYIFKSTAFYTSFKTRNKNFKCTALQNNTINMYTSVSPIAGILKKYFLKLYIALYHSVLWKFLRFFLDLKIDNFLPWIHAKPRSCCFQVVFKGQIYQTSNQEKIVIKHLLKHINGKRT